MQNTQIIILAAGKGTRMETDLPKVLVPIHNKPMVSYTIDAVHDLDHHPTLVLGHKSDLVQQIIGDQCNYVIQEEQLGTGHAVQAAESAILPETKTVVVLYGDHPLVSSKTIKTLVEKQQATKQPLVLATTTVPDFEDWRAAFYRYGRIIRNDDGDIEKIVELKDSNDAEREVTEVNPAYFCFDRHWLFNQLHTLRNNNAQGEYYLTDLVERARMAAPHTPSISIPPEEALGVNTVAEIQTIESILK